MSREPDHFIVYGFPSTHDALAAEALLEDVGVEVTPIPTPRTLGALCGIALRVPLGESDRADGYLTAAAIAWTARTAVQDL